MLRGRLFRAGRGLVFINQSGVFKSASIAIWLTGHGVEVNLRVTSAVGRPV